MKLNDYTENGVSPIRNWKLFNDRKYSRGCEYYSRVIDRRIRILEFANGPLLKMWKPGFVWMVNFPDINVCSKVGGFVRFFLLTMFESRIFYD